MPSPELLPCPFCGAEAETSLHCDYDEIIAVVRCTECPAFVRIPDDILCWHCLSKRLNRRQEQTRETILNICRIAKEG